MGASTNREPRLRKTFSNIEKVIDIPNLLDIQNR